MKKSDLAVVVLIASIAMLVALFATRAIIGDSLAGNTRVKTVDKINATIQEPDPAIFNEQAINPAVEVKVGSETE